MSEEKHARRQRRDMQLAANHIPTDYERNGHYDQGRQRTPPLGVQSLNQQAVDPLETARQFVATPTAFALVVF